MQRVEFRKHKFEFKPVQGKQPSSVDSQKEEEEKKKHVEKQRAAQEVKQFRRYALQVADLGASQLKGKEKKLFEINRLKRLGAKLPKNGKMPYKLLQQSRRKSKEQEKKQREVDQLVGNVSRKYLKLDSVTWRPKLDRDRFKDRNLQQRPSGRESSGIVVPNHLLRRKRS